MKKIILFLISMALVFSITGCKAKKAVTAEEFKSKMTQEWYQIADISEKYAGKGAKAVLIAMKDGYQIEFYVTENKDYAVGSYNLNKEKIEKEKTKIYYHWYRQQRGQRGRPPGRCCQRIQSQKAWEQLLQHTVRLLRWVEGLYHWICTQRQHIYFKRSGWNDQRNHCSY